MAQATETSTSGGIGDSPQTIVAVLFGAVLALVGVLGPVLGGASGELIIFGRNYLHDAIHLLSGLAGLVAGYYAGGQYAAEYNKALGVVYLLVTILGFALFDLFADLIALNTADNFLHLALAVVFLAVGFALGDS
ncbi:DUF4383 domain-containing protein [Haloglomus litoreum]|uniref:DUF4383 domain-containing protein n=1 Tax=Haloglomus litoreum TaxID=3034026 RepID=UPI0023E7D4B3|nr:DUF4383 domain-containing protein [Haloglomus sp. DT116]